MTNLQTNAVLISAISERVLSFSAFFLPSPLLRETFRVKLLKAVLLWQNVLPALLLETCFYLLVYTKINISVTAAETEVLSSFLFQQKEG